MLLAHRHFIAAQLLLALLYFGLYAPMSHAQIHRCGNHYSATPCPGGRVIETPPGTPSAHTSRQAHHGKRIERELDQAETARPPMRQTMKPSAACAAVNQRIQKIDELARKGGSAQKMEKLREARKAARDRQFRMGC